MFFKKKFDNNAVYDWLIVGLGNPGKRYAFTRHNAGFLCLDYFAEKQNVKIDRLKFQSLLGEVRLSGKRCLLMKPQTFMNNSGEAVREAAQFYKIDPAHMLVLFDDISLDPGRMRIRRKGTDGGHKGIKSIIYHLGADDFPRVKIGVGAKPHEDYDLADWVTSPFSKEELLTLRDVAEKTADAIELIVNGEIDEAMSRYNS